MGEIESKIVWINKVASGSRLKEAEGDAKLIYDTAGEVMGHFKERLESAKIRIFNFEQALGHVQEKSLEYAHADLKDRDLFRRKLMVSCRTCIEKLKEVEKSFEKL